MPPRPKSGTEVQSVLTAEREGLPFLVYRNADDEQLVRRIDPPTMTIGRDASCDIAITWDPSVSRTHAVLELLGDAWTIADDGISRNGTYLNAARLTLRRRLVDGDAIRVGETLIQFRHPLEGTVAVTSTQEPMLAVALTPMQRKVLVALCRPMLEGHSGTPAPNAAIAAALVLSVDAVKTHLRGLSDRFAVGDLPQNQKRAKVAELALRAAIVTERDL